MSLPLARERGGHELGSLPSNTASTFRLCYLLCHVIDLRVSFLHTTVQPRSTQVVGIKLGSSGEKFVLLLAQHSLWGSVGQDRAVLAGNRRCKNPTRAGQTGSIAMGQEERQSWSSRFHSWINKLHLKDTVWEIKNTDWPGICCICTKRTALTWSSAVWNSMISTWWTDLQTLFCFN